MNIASGFSDWTFASNCAGRAVSHSPLVDVMVNASELPSLFLNLPTAVQFPGDGHDTEEKIASGFSDWMSSPNCAGRAVSHSPSVDVMVNATLLPSLFTNVPTAVQFPGDEHDTEENSAILIWTSSPGNCAGRAVSHSPSVSVMVNALLSPSLFLNSPTAVQFPGDEHDTDLNLARGPLSPGNSARCASSHSPSVDVMVNAS